MIRAVTVCVEYDDILAFTLPRMLQVFDHVTVVTSRDDLGTFGVVEALRTNGAKAHLHQTDAFYLDGCAFNKGRAIEEAFSKMNRVGWLAVIDADIAVPLNLFDRPPLDECSLYSTRRRHAPLERLSDWGDDDDWRKFPMIPDGEHGGWLQVFHARAAGDAPWYPTMWKHAGGCDSGFMLKWPRNRRCWLGRDVLHFGDEGVNWHGRITERADGRPVGGPFTLPKRKEALAAFKQNRESKGKRAYADERLDGETRVRS